MDAQEKTDREARIAAARTGLRQAVKAMVKADHGHVGSNSGAATEAAGRGTPSGQGEPSGQ